MLRTLNLAPWFEIENEDTHATASKAHERNSQNDDGISKICAPIRARPGRERRACQAERAVRSVDET